MLSKTFYGSHPSRQNERFVTFREACERAEEDRSRVRNVVVLPPDSGDQEVDSDVEDANDVMSSDEEVFEPAGELEVDDSEDSDDDEVEPPAKSSRTTGWRKKFQFRRNLCSDPLKKLVELFPDLTELSPYQLWGCIFNPSILDTIVDQTNLHARRDKNQPNFNVNHDEIRAFLGILLLSGYHRLPEEKHYWSTQPDLGVQLVSAVMTRNKFQALKSAIHFADNSSLPTGDKLAKIEPIYKILNENLKKHGIFHQKLSIDESMVPYYGRHSAKMFIRGKPIRFGYKIWAICGNDGYPYKLKLYRGKEQNQPKLPLGTRVVNDMMSVIQSCSAVTRHEVYFDNFFTSHALLKSLAEQNIKATGTIRENRTAGAAKLMKSNSALKKEERGEFDFRCDGEVYVCKWNDNSIVSIASNHETHVPFHEATRRVKRSSNVKVKQPYLVHKYNEGMGGVDLMDRLLATYRPGIRGKKWYWPLFSNALNLSVVAAWRMHCQLVEDPLSHLEFRREVTLCLLKSVTPRAHVGQSKITELPADIRYDGLGHNKQRCKQGRCAVCKKNARYQCSKCLVRLHFDKGTECARNYHTESK